MRVMIRRDRTIEAICFHDRCGISHGLGGADGGTWWAWTSGGVDHRWEGHPDPDGMWARFVAYRLCGGEISHLDDVKEWL